MRGVGRSGMERWACRFPGDALGGLTLSFRDVPLVGGQDINVAIAVVGDRTAPSLTQYDNGLNASVAGGKIG